MKAKRTTKLFIIFLTLIFSIQFWGCNPAVPEVPFQQTSQPVELDNPEKLAEILTYDFECKVYATQKSDRDFLYLWNIEKTNDLPTDKNYYSYMIEYGEQNSDFYLVYLKSERIAECRQYLEEYYNARVDEKNFKNNYYFTPQHDNEAVVDGKYLFAFVNLGGKAEDLKLCKASDITQAALHLADGWQLVFCVKERSALLMENMSTGKLINKDMTVYASLALEYNDAGQVRDLQDKNNVQQYVDTCFDRSATLVQLYPEKIEEMTVLCHPQDGWTGEEAWLVRVYISVVEKDGIKYFALPKYHQYGGKGKFDLFGDFDGDDVIFGTKETEFYDAYVRMPEEGEFSGVPLGYYLYLFGLYDYDKVCELLRR